MKTSLTFSILLISCFTFLQAQTKLIAHKSHSGSFSNFKIALENNLFDMEASNFGAAPIELIQTARLDTLIYLSDSTAIMITSDICRQRRRGIESLWKAGRDTVYYHPLFRLQHKKDSIKEVLDKTYHFKNPADSVVFIGYDNVMPILEKPSVQIEPQVEESTIEIEVPLTKKQIRKAKRDLKRKKRKAKRARKKLDKTLEKYPEIKPAAIIPIDLKTPKDPPSMISPTKFILVIGVGILALCLGFFRSKLSQV